MTATAEALEETRFSYRSARSGSLVVGLSAAIAIETVALHFLLAARHPVLAATLTALGVLSISWLVRDYVALGRNVVRADAEFLHLKVGRRFALTVPLEEVDRVLQPTYRDLPAPGTNHGRDYLNLTKPAQPNVLILLRRPITVRLPGGFRRQAQRLGVHLDDPASFVAMLAVAAQRGGA